jgi:hypothetical protein
MVIEVSRHKTERKLREQNRPAMSESWTGAKPWAPEVLQQSKIDFVSLRRVMCGERSKRQRTRNERPVRGK